MTSNIMLRDRSHRLAPAPISNAATLMRALLWRGAWVTALFFVAAFPPRSNAQAVGVVDNGALAGGSISGSLVPAPQAKLPITGVTVTIEETGDRAIVDRRGEFTFQSVKPGTYTLVASGEGFSRVSRSPTSSIQP